MAYDTPYQHKPGTGRVFKNSNKTEDWHGDYKGKIMLPDGTMHYVDMFNAAKKDGEQYLRIKIGKPIAQTGEAYSAAHKPFPPQDAHNKAKSNGFDLDDDLPPF